MPGLFSGVRHKTGGGTLPRLSLALDLFLEWMLWQHFCLFNKNKYTSYWDRYTDFNIYTLIYSDSTNMKIHFNPEWLWSVQLWREKVETHRKRRYGMEETRKGQITQTTIYLFGSDRFGASDLCWRVGGICGTVKEQAFIPLACWSLALHLPVSPRNSVPGAARYWGISLNQLAQWFSNLLASGPT